MIGGGEAQCRKGGTVLGMSAIMFYMPLSYFCVVLTAKIDNINGNCKRRCERNSIPKKSSLSG